MAYPTLVLLADENAYFELFKSNYCAQGTVTTVGGLVVKFRERHFKHAFYQAADRKRGDKSVFSRERAERMDWIEVALRDATAELHVGYDNKKKRLCPERRVSISNANYVVICEIEKSGDASFVTAFPAGPSTLAKVRRNPKWTGK